VTTAAETKTISKKAAYLRLATVLLVAVAIAAIGIGFLSLNAPTLGETCSVEHSATQDASGHAMSCDPKMPGSNELVWQYMPDSELETQNDRG
jgi:hypothetical protein